MTLVNVFANGGDSILSTLRASMWIHAVLNTAGGALLFFAPSTADSFLEATTHPLLVRIFGAALLSIGLLSAAAATYRRADKFVGVLLMKSLWAPLVSAALLLTIFQFRTDNKKVPTAMWALLCVFLVGAVVWNFYRVILQRKRCEMKSVGSPTKRNQRLSW